MITYFEKRHSSLSYRILSTFIAFTFIFSLVLPPGYAQLIPQTLLNLPAPGTMVPPSNGFIAPRLIGVTVHPDNPLKFDFIVNTGDADLAPEALKEESRKLIKYFLASLTVPEDELWVNLSPYEKDRMVPPGLGDTEMGRDMLAQDYLLKQLTASLMYPEKELGKEFWAKIYQEAHDKYGTTEIPVNTFNKVWVVPQEAVVYEKDTSAFVVKSHLKVMLEEDYMAVSHQSSVISHQNLTTARPGIAKRAGDDGRLTTQIIKEIILPAIEQEVNEGKNFANLRQMYHSLILAAWYKLKLKDGLLGKIYVDQNKTKGIDTEDKAVNRKIYDHYLESFKKGVYNYIKEDIDPQTQDVIPRKYFSGGVGFNKFVNDKVKGLGSKLLALVLATMVSKASIQPAQAAELMKEIENGKNNSVEVVLGENPLKSAEETLAALEPSIDVIQPTQLAQATKDKEKLKGPVSSPVGISRREVEELLRSFLRSYKTKFTIEETTKKIDRVVVSFAGDVTIFIRPDVTGREILDYVFENYKGGFNDDIETTQVVYMAHVFKEGSREKILDKLSELAREDVNRGIRESQPSFPKKTRITAMKNLSWGVRGITRQRFIEVAAYLEGIASNKQEEEDIRKAAKDALVDFQASYRHDLWKMRMAGYEHVSSSPVNLEEEIAGGKKVGDALHTVLSPASLFAGDFLKGGYKQPGYGVEAGAVIDGSHAVGEEGNQGYYVDRTNVPDGKGGFKSGRQVFVDTVNDMKVFFARRAEFNKPVRVIIKTGIGGQHTPFQGMASVFERLDSGGNRILGEYELGKDFESYLTKIVREMNIDWDQIAVVPSSKSGSTDETMIVFTQIIPVLLGHVMQTHVNENAAQNIFTIDQEKIGRTFLDYLHTINFKNGKELPAGDLFKNFNLDDLVSRIHGDGGPNRLIPPEWIKQVLGKVLGNMFFETTDRPAASRLSAFIRNSGLDRILGKDAPGFGAMFDNVGGRWTGDLHMMTFLSFYNLDPEAYWRVRYDGIKQVRAGTHQGNAIGNKILNEDIKKIALVVPDEYFWFGKSIEQNFNESIWQEGFANLRAVKQSTWGKQKRYYESSAQALVLNLADLAMEDTFNVVNIDPVRAHSKQELAQEFGRLLTTFYGMTYTVGTRLIARALFEEGNYRGEGINVDDLNDPATKILQENLFLRQPFVELGKNLLEKRLTDLQAAQQAWINGGRQGISPIAEAVKAMIDAARGKEMRALNPFLNVGELPELVKRAAFEARQTGKTFVPFVYLAGEEFVHSRDYLQGLGVEWVLQGSGDQHISWQQVLAQPRNYLPFIISFVPEAEHMVPGLPAVGFAKGYLDNISPHMVRDYFAEASYQALVDQGGEGIFMRILDTQEMRGEIEAAFETAFASSPMGEKELVYGIVQKRYPLRMLPDGFAASQPGLYGDNYSEILYSGDYEFLYERLDGYINGISGYPLAEDAFREMAKSMDIVDEKGNSQDESYRNLSIVLSFSRRLRPPLKVLFDEVIGRGKIIKRLMELFPEDAQNVITAEDTAPVTLESLKEYFGMIGDRAGIKLVGQILKTHGGASSSPVVKTGLSEAIGVAAQRITPAAKANTGELNVDAAIRAGANGALAGHSEARSNLGDTDEIANEQLRAAHERNLDHILFAFGEKLEVRENGKEKEFVKTQIQKGLAGLTADQVAKTIFAYEPIWAIGTGKTATPQQAQEMARFVRDTVASLYSKEVADKIIILYGGSVIPETAAELIAQEDIDGFLVGGASNEYDSFTSIIKTVETHGPANGRIPYVGGNHKTKKIKTGYYSVLSEFFKTLDTSRIHVSVLPSVGLITEAAQAMASSPMRVTKQAVLTWSGFDDLKIDETIKITVKPSGKDLKKRVSVAEVGHIKQTVPSSSWHRLKQELTNDVYIVELKSKTGKNNLLFNIGSDTDGLSWISVFQSNDGENYEFVRDKKSQAINVAETMKTLTFRVFEGEKRIEVVVSEGWFDLWTAIKRRKLITDAELETLNGYRFKFKLASSPVTLEENINRVIEYTGRMHNLSNTAKRYMRKYLIAAVGDARNENKADEIFKNAMDNLTKEDYGSHFTDDVIRNSSRGIGHRRVIGLLFLTARKTLQPGSEFSFTALGRWQYDIAVDSFLSQGNRYRITEHSDDTMRDLGLDKEAPPSPVSSSLVEARDLYRDFYDSFGAKNKTDGAITGKDVGAFSQAFLSPDAQLLPYESRRNNGTLGVTEVNFLEDSATRQRMTAFQQQLKAAFGDKVYLVDSDKLHFTIQGLETQWDDKDAGTKKELAMHNGLEAIDMERGVIREVRERARNIVTPSFKMQVAGLNWNPQTGIFWELRPYLAGSHEDPVMQRRKTWELPQPRPPHVTAAYFTQEFNPEDMTKLRQLVAQYQNSDYFGDIAVNNVEVIAYTDFSFNAGYKVLENVPLTASSPVSKEEGARRINNLFDVLREMVEFRIPEDWVGLFEGKGVDYRWYAEGIEIYGDEFFESGENIVLWLGDSRAVVMTKDNLQDMTRDLIERDPDTAGNFLEELEAAIAHFQLVEQQEELMQKIEGTRGVIAGIVEGIREKKSRISKLSQEERAELQNENEAWKKAVKEMSGLAADLRDIEKELAKIKEQSDPASSPVGMSLGPEDKGLLDNVWKKFEEGHVIGVGERSEEAKRFVETAHREIRRWGAKESAYDATYSFGNVPYFLYTPAWEVEEGWVEDGDEASLDKESRFGARTFLTADKKQLFIAMPEDPSDVLGGKKDISLSIHELWRSAVSPLMLQIVLGDEKEDSVKVGIVANVRQQGEQAGATSSPVEDSRQSSDISLQTDLTTDDRGLMTKPGGIDLNPALLNLQIKRDGNGVPLPLPMQPIENMHIEGFLPIIINITPITNLPMLLGFADTKQDADEIMPGMKAREPEEISALN